MCNYDTPFFKLSFLCILTASYSLIIYLTFEGEKPFLLVEETVKQEDELTIIPTMGEPYMFMDTIGALSDNSLTWSSGNMEYYLVSDVMNQEELIEVASSINVLPTMK